MNKSILNKQGQSTIEGSILLVVLTLFTGTFLFSAYLFYSYYWVDHILYEALICLEVSQSKNSCQKIANLKLREVLFMNNNIQIQIKSSQDHFTTSLQIPYQLPIFNFKDSFQIKKSIRH